MLKRTTLVTFAVAALTAVTLIAVAPNLLARGGGGGSGGGRGDGSGGEAPEGSGGAGQPGNMGSGTGDGGGDREGPRDDDRETRARNGEEQRQIDRDAMNGHARDRFRSVRDQLNRRSSEPSRGR